MAASRPCVSMRRTEVGLGNIQAPTSWLNVGRLTSRALDTLRHQPAGVAVDYAGTLVSMADADAGYQPLPAATTALNELQAHGIQVAIVGSRPARELARRVGLQGVTYIGQQGLEWLSKGQLEQATLEAEDLERFRDGCATVRRYLRVLDGVSLTQDLLGLSINYGDALLPLWTREQIARLLTPLAQAGLVVFEGRRRFELRPLGTPGKRAAIAQLIASQGLASLIYFGDDRMDLPVFRMLRERREREELASMTVAVLNEEASSAVPEAADSSVDGPAGVVGFIRSVAGGLARARG